MNAESFNIKGKLVTAPVITPDGFRSLSVKTTGGTCTITNTNGVVGDLNYVMDDGEDWNMTEDGRTFNSVTITPNGAAVVYYVLT